MKIYNESITIKHKSIISPEKHNRIAFLASQTLEDKIKRASEKLGLSKSMFIRSLVISYCNENEI
jgi:hypothetical protein